MRRYSRRPAVAVMAVLCVLAMPAGSVHAADSGTGQSATADEAPSRLVVRRDVDGDGRRDRVYVKHRNDDVSVLRVDRARGSTLRQVIRTTYWPGSPWYGAAKIDGHSGFELVTGYTSGAHRLFFRAWTVRAGDLVRLDAPGRGREWVVDASYSANIGVSRRSPNKPVFIVTRSAVRDRDGKGHHGRVRTYRWKKDRLNLVSSKKHRWSNKGAYRLSGWHILGLPRYL